VSDVLKMYKFDAGARSDTNFAESHLAALSTVFNNVQVREPEFFPDLVAFFEQLFKSLPSWERFDEIVKGCLTLLLTPHPHLIPNFVRAAFGTVPSVVSAFISAMAATFKAVPNTDPAALLAVGVFNLMHGEEKVRCSAFRLMVGLLGSAAVPCERADLMIFVPDGSPSGYLSQAAHICAYLAKQLKPDVAAGVLRALATNFGKSLVKPSLLLSSLRALLERCVGGRAVSAKVLLQITTSAGFVDCLDVQELRLLWAQFCKLFKDGKEVAQIVSSWTEDQAVGSPGVSAGLSVLGLVFEAFPAETSALLLQKLSRLGKSLPSSPQELVRAFETPELVLEGERPELLACAAISHILLVADKQRFDAFAKQLPMLSFMAAFSYDKEEFHVGRAPLLDALLDALLFRFNADSSKQRELLEVLQGKNLLMAAACVGPQFALTTRADETRRILAYDQEAISCIIKLADGVVKHFGRDFVKKAFSVATRAKDSPRSGEPFLMLLAARDRLNSSFVLQLLLYTPVAMAQNRLDSMTTVIEICRERQSTGGKKFFQREAPAFAASLLVYLSKVERPSQATPVLEVLASLVNEATDFTPVSQVVTDKFAAAAFINGIVDAVTLGHDAVKACLVALEALTTVKGFDGFCRALLITLDYLRTASAAVSKKTVAPVHLKGGALAEAVAELVAVCETQEVRLFVTDFIGYYLTRFKCADTAKHQVALSFLAVFQAAAKSQLTGGQSDDLVKLATLCAFGLDDVGQQAAGAVVGDVVGRIGYAFEGAVVSVEQLKPEFATTPFRGYEHGLQIQRQMVLPAQLPVYRQIVPLDNKDISKQVCDALARMLCVQLAAALAAAKKK
jgi:hypothetical protein